MTGEAVLGVLRPAPTFSNQSAAVLRDMILSGQLKLGERINEVETANTLGISRAPLREAIQALVNEGLLISITNRGAFVRTFSKAELEDLYELRIALERHQICYFGSSADQPRAIAIGPRASPRKRCVR